MDRHPGYPFDPRSTANVRPGDFWAIPTRGDRYCHVKTVRETGGMLLGNSEPPTVAGLDDPDLSVWGYRFIANLADRYVGRQVPENSADPR